MGIANKTKQVLGVNRRQNQVSQLIKRIDSFRVKSLAALLIAIIATLFPILTIASDDALVMGIFPRRGATDTIQSFTPLANHLSKTLNREVKLETTHDFPSFWRGVMSRRYDMVHFNQYHYVRSNADAGYQVIAMNEEFGESSIAGIIVASKDSTIRDHTDLRDKKVIFGGNRQAMLSYILPTYILRKAGLQDNDYDMQFANNPPNALYALRYGQADAAAIGDVLPSFLADKPGIKKSANALVEILRSEAIAQLPWAVKDTTSPQLRNEIQQTLLSLNASKEGKEILSAAHLTNIVYADDTHYDRVRDITSVVLQEEY